MEFSVNSDADSSALRRSKKEFFVLTTRHWLKFISNLAIPLIIGVFTIFIAIHQQNVAQTNRDKDAMQAAQLRKEDLELPQVQRAEDKETARLQSEEDKKTAYLQREEDQKIARLQREEDGKTARLQRDTYKETARLDRELDLNMAIDKRIQEYELAEKQRSLYQSQRAHEFGIVQENYMNDLMLIEDRQNDNILVNYQRELSALLIDYKTKLKEFDYTFVFVLQMKTRAVLRVLNPARRTIVVQTLSRADLLRATCEKETSPLYKGNLSGVIFGQPLDPHAYNAFVRYDCLHIEEADLRHASFRSLSFGKPPVFDFSNLDYTDWSFSLLMHIEFDDKITMNNAIFAKSLLISVAFDAILMNRVSFQYNKLCSKCIFLETSLLGARLDHSNFSQSTFAEVSMADSNMSNGSFIDSVFEKVILDRVDLSGADLQQCVFQNVSMVNCSMFEVKLQDAKFSNVNLTGCIGLRHEQIYSMTTIDNVTLPNGTLLNSYKSED